MADPKSQQPSLISFSTLFAVGTATIILGLLYYRLYLSVEFTDEAFYVAIPFRFVLGDRPFVDEMNLAQTMGFISYPFLKLFYLLFHTNTLIVLYMRHVFLAFYGLIGVIAFRTIREFFRWQTALVIALTGMVFVPANIMNMSYNNLSMGFFAIGGFLLLSAIRNPGNSWRWIFAGFAHALSGLSYPTRLMVSAIFIPIIFVYTKKPRFRPFLFYALGYAPLVLLMGFLTFHSGWQSLQAMFDYFYSFMRNKTYNFGQFFSILKTLWRSLPDKAFLLPMLAAVFFGFKKKPQYFFLPLVFAPLAVLRIVSIPEYRSLEYMAFFTLLVPFYYLQIRKTAPMKMMFYGLWIPALISGLVVALSSSNGFLNSGIGFFPGSLIMAFFAAVAVEENVPPTSAAARIAAKAKIMPALIVLISMTATLYAKFYRDESYPALTSVVKSGPYKGIRTSPEKNRYLEKLMKDLERFLRPGDRLLFYDRFPAGYLLTTHQAATDNCWLFPMMRRGATLEYYRKMNIWPDLAIRMKRVFNDSQDTNVLSYPRDDVLNAFIEASYEIVLSCPEYDIFRRAGK